MPLIVSPMNLGMLLDDYRELCLSYGPVGYWRLNEASGNAADISGNNLTLTAFAATYSQAGALSEDPDTCFSWNGTSTNLSRTDSTLTITGDWSISIWANAVTWSGESIMMTHRDDGESPPTNIIYEMNIISGTTVRFFHESGSGTNHLVDISIAGDPLVAGTWYHLVGTRDVSTNTYQLYIDGVDRGSGTYTADPNDGSSGTFNMGDNDATNATMNGRLDEPAIFDKVLSLGQALALYKAGKGII